MLLPTQDNELHELINTIISNLRRDIEIEDIDFHYQSQLDAQGEILKAFEELGYHKGLPSSIEEALNSGDGSYHP